MSQQSLERQWSCLRRYIGLRVNLFRALNDGHFVVAADRSAVALRSGDFALTASVGFDAVFLYYYVKDCSWYRSDLSKLDDDDVPERCRYELLRRLRAVLD